jgi:hypothetical protein
MAFGFSLPIQQAPPASAAKQAAAHDVASSVNVVQQHTSTKTNGGRGVAAAAVIKAIAIPGDC